MGLQSERGAQEFFRWDGKVDGAETDQQFSGICQDVVIVVCDCICEGRAGVGMSWFGLGVEHLR